MNNNLIVGGGYTCSRCGQYHRTSTVCHCDVETTEVKTTDSKPYPKDLKVKKYTGQKLEVGKYLVVRKDGKTHFENYNGTGWAYNEKAIEYFYLPKIS